MYFHKLARDQRARNDVPFVEHTNFTEIYVTQEVLHQYVMDRFIRVLERVNNNNTPSAYCGERGALPIRKGPPIDARAGTYVVRFVEGNGGSTGCPLTSGNLRRLRECDRLCLTELTLAV
jgi:hypothetical protein